jgi:hypothetical protein
MSNIKFLYDGIESAAVSASAGSQAGYDVTNIQDRNPNIVWKSPAFTIGQTLLIVLTTARDVNSVIIDGINAGSLNTATATIRLQSSTNGTAWTDRKVFATADMANATRLYTEFISVNAAYWRLVFNDSSILMNKPEIGSILLGTRLEPDIPYNEVPDHGEQFATSFSRALDKTPYSSQSTNDGIETWKSMQWVRVPGTLWLAFKKMSHTCRGRLRPLYFIDVDGSIYLVMLPDRVKDQQVMYDQYTISLELEAFLPGTIKLT